MTAASDRPIHSPRRVTLPLRGCAPCSARGRARRHRPARAGAPATRRTARRTRRRAGSTRSTRPSGDRGVEAGGRAGLIEGQERQVEVLERGRADGRAPDGIGAPLVEVHPRRKDVLPTVAVGHPDLGRGPAPMRIHAVAEPGHLHRVGSELEPLSWLQGRGGVRHVGLGSGNGHEDQHHPEVHHVAAEAAPGPGGGPPEGPGERLGLLAHPHPDRQGHLAQGDGRHEAGEAEGEEGGAPSQPGGETDDDHRDAHAGRKEELPLHRLGRGATPGQRRAHAHQEQHGDAQRDGHAVEVRPAHADLHARERLADQREHGAEEHGEGEGHEEQVVDEERRLPRGDRARVAFRHQEWAAHREQDDARRQAPAPRNTRKVGPMSHWVKECTELKTPERVMKVPRMVSRKLASNSVSVHPLEDPLPLLDHRRVDEGGGGQPGQERRVLDRIPRPVAAPAEHLVRPPRRRARCPLRGRSRAISVQLRSGRHQARRARRAAAPPRRSRTGRSSPRSPGRASAGG